MANSQTVKFPIEIVYKGADDTVKVHNFTLTLSLSLEEIGAEASTCGEITINGAMPNGAVMPVDDQPKTLEEPKVDEVPQGSDSMQEAA